MLVEFAFGKTQRADGTEGNMMKVPRGSQNGKIYFHFVRNANTSSDFKDNNDRMQVHSDLR